MTSNDEWVRERALRSLDDHKWRIRAEAAEAKLARLDNPNEALVERLCAVGCAAGLTEGLRRPVIRDICREIARTLENSE